MPSPLNLSIYGGPASEDEKPGPGRLTLEEARASFCLLGKGLSERYLQAKPLHQAPAFLANPRRPFPFSSGREIYLPEDLDVFDDRADNWRVFRLYTCVQAEQWEAGTFDRPRAEEVEALCGREPWMEKQDPLGWIRYFLGRFPMPGLAGEIFLTLETARVASSMAGRFRGLAADLDWFLPRLGALTGPMGGGGILWSLFFALLSHDPAVATGALQEGLLERSRRVAEPGARFKDTLDATLDLYELLEPMMRAASRRGEGIPFQGLDEFFSDIMPGLRGNRATRHGVPTEEEGTGLVPPELGEVLNLDFFSALVPSGLGDFVFQEALGRKIEMSASSDVYEQAKAARKEALESRDMEGEVEKRLHYPEWDYLAGGYRRNWTTLYQIKADEGEETAARRLLERWEELVREVSRQFRLLRLQERTWRKRLEFGEEIDVQQAVEREVERRCGLPPSEKVYMEKRRVVREVSALFLLDLSASTSSEIEEGSHRGETVLQVLTASVAIMARALEQLGDRYGVYGFSGYGRDRVEFLRIKSFDEPLGDAAWQRLGGLSPMKSTRMGPAVRHAHHLLDAEPSSLKLMLLLSDGYPQDYDYGEDRTDREYGLRDTAQSLREAEAGHIIPFCLTVDAAGHDYLRRMCPPHGYLVLKSVEDLPRELPKVYLRLRGV